MRAARCQFQRDITRLHFGQCGKLKAVQNKNSISSPPPPPQTTEGVFHTVIKKYNKAGVRVRN